MTPLKFVSVGMGHVACANRITVIARPDTLSSKRQVNHARDNNKYIDASVGRHIRSTIILDDGTVIASSISAKTMLKRLNANEQIEIDLDTDAPDDDREGELA